jgi:hypothetical protein
MASEPPNPYQSPPESREESYANRPADRDRRVGPAVYIVLFAVIGAVPGIPLLANDNAFGLLGVILGAVLGGVVYRLRSRNWPIDPTARARRHNYALAAAIFLPILIDLASDMNMQGLAWALLSVLVGAAVAVGILVSGDRRFASGGTHKP